MEPRPAINKCHYCHHIGPDVNSKTKDIYIGGRGLAEFPCCDDAKACIERVEKNYEIKFVKEKV